MIKWLVSGLTGCLLSVATCLLLAEVSEEEDYGARPDVDVFIAEMVAEHGFSEAQLKAWFADTHRRQPILDAISRPAEKTKTWAEYRQIFMTSWRLEKGVEFWRQHQDILNNVSASTGVPAEFIVAIIGVETGYGRYTGRYRVIDALSTLAFDYPPRKTFFRKELKHYLLLTREQQRDPLSLKGSYAGAMGLGQFMPSSYRSYAADYDGDGFANIWSDPGDAIASVANYFVRHGWRPGEAVVKPAAVDASLDEGIFVKSLKPEYTVEGLHLKGFYSQAELEGKLPARAMRLEGSDGVEYWLGLHNFYVITRYNHSELYAMAVCELGRQLKQGIQNDGERVDSEG